LGDAIALSQGLAQEQGMGDVILRNDGKDVIGMTKVIELTKTNETGN